jgi:hypothetical protein
MSNEKTKDQIEVHNTRYKKSPEKLLPARTLHQLL